MALYLFVVLRPANFSELFSDCLNVKLFTTLPFFVAFYDQQGILGTKSRWDFSNLYEMKKQFCSHKTREKRLIKPSVTDERIMISEAIQYHYHHSMEPQ